MPTYQSQSAGNTDRYHAKLASSVLAVTPSPPPHLSDLSSFDAATPLTAWLRTVLWAAVLVPLGIFIAVAWWGLNQAQTDAEATARRATQFASEHARNALDVASDVIRRTAGITTGTDEELVHKEMAIRQRLSDVSTGLPMVVNINVWDAAGRPLVRSDAPPDRTAVVKDRSYFAVLRDSPRLLEQFDGFTVSEVIAGRQTGRELMNLAWRRPSADGSFRGVIAVSFAPSFFRDHYRSLTDENSYLASFALVRNDGTLLARWPVRQDGRDRMRDDNPVLQHILAGEVEGIAERVDEPGREARLVSFRQVQGYPVYVIASLNRSAVFAQWKHFLTLLASILAPVTAVLVYVSWVALRKTRQESAASAALGDEIRRRSAAEKAALEAQRLETLSVLTGGVAHDFNNLLAIISTSLHVHTRKHPAEAGEPQVRAMTRAIKSGVRLTRQLLSFSRKQALNPETIHLQSWLPATADLLRTSLGNHILMHYEVLPDTGAIHVDTGELELALINLAVNARHALLEGGNFTIKASNADSTEVVIEVRDDGVGIPSDILPRVLEPFFSTRERGAGSGLGLSQVHGFLSQSGGSVQIASSLGKGTCVLLRFPRVQGQMAKADEGEEMLAPLAGAVLLVEDNEEVAQATAEMLMANGLQVERAAQPQEALQWLESQPLPDLVLSDIAMPGGMDGISFAFLLRERYPQLPVILATGYADKLESAVRGGLEVFPKPLSPDRLLRRLRELLQERSQSAL